MNIYIPHVHKQEHILDKMELHRATLGGEVEGNKIKAMLSVI